MNSRRQRESIYKPLRERLQSATTQTRSLVHHLTDRTALQFFVHDFVGSLGVDSPNSRFPWRTLSFVTVLGFLLVALLRTALRMFRRREYGRTFQEWLQGVVSPAAVAQPARVEFFRRLEKLLARRRFRRRAPQTQREFAEQVARELPPLADEPGAAHRLRAIVEAFYRVRFGSRPLDSQETEAIERALHDLEQTLAKQDS
jgi:hypothetical protein